MDQRIQSEGSLKLGEYRDKVCRLETILWQKKNQTPQTHKSTPSFAQAQQVENDRFNPSPYCGGEKWAPSGVFTLQHSGQLHDLGADDHARSAQRLISLSLQCQFMPNLDTQACAGPYRTGPSAASVVHGRSSEGGRAAGF